MSEGLKALSLDKFLYYYKPFHVHKAERMYYFKCRKRERQLVTKIPSSNRDWKEKFFFVPGSDWACRPDEVAIAEPVDYTWGILPKSAQVLPRLTTEDGGRCSQENKRVQEATALAAATIKEGKLQLSKPGDKRKFGVDTSPKPFGTITRPKETPSHPSVTPSHLASVECPRAPSRGKGPLTPPKPPLLINDATYAVEQVKSIIKEEDIDDCDEYAPTTIEESGLHDLAKAIMRMKTLELWCRDYEDQMVNLWKRVKNNNEVIKELKGSVTPSKEKKSCFFGR